ncbi:MGDG synthase family glycosyltransferase [Actinacidiphila paucisporea]|uniref:UDP-N-acetylglucosamine:LPS N-acetylglucosamine transferase n=1 Tax=Actinacidiphila paucisporea TaxID=310782 RepID=A0A1M7LSB6_9ACTN|nr:glycosyltransferase [Actinacidiphila paucisporea]SHM81185.1 UDP-N-acetylglucosamine:LPS N-acetylglucosamine transferase [Actinacidiphila paucisporea]
MPVNVIPAPPGPARPRIVIISAGVGAGHDGAADQLAERLLDDGFTVDRHDFLDLLPGRLGAALAGTYHRLLVRAPGGYQRIYAATERGSRPGPAVAALLRTARRRMLRAIPQDTAAVVSTYPAASQVLGALRRRGELAVPAVTYLTDFSVHALWVAPGVDVHLAAHQVPARQAAALNAAGVRVCAPVVGRGFGPASATQRPAARTAFGLPEDVPLALLVAGSWGVGAVEQAAADLRDCGAAVPVVVCGRNERLADRLRAQGFAHVHEWVADMPGLMRACDVLVQNAGGLTSLEAFAAGLPVLSYRCIPGHGQTNAAALAEAGLAPWVKDPDALAPALRDLLRGGGAGRALFRDGVCAAAAVAEVARGKVPVPVPVAPTPRTLPRRKSPGRPLPRPAALRGVRALALTAALTVLLGIGAPLGEAYGDSPGHFASLAHFLDGDPR